LEGRVDRTGRIEREVERDMQSFYGSKTIQDVILEGKLIDNDLSTSCLLELIGLDAIINVYCTPGMHFDGKCIRSELENLGICKINVVKIYVLLECWRREMIPNIKNQKRVDKQTRNDCVRVMASPTTSSSLTEYSLLD
jgi:hypothetical protein